MTIFIKTNILETDFLKLTTHNTKKYLLVNLPVGLPLLVIVKEYSDLQLLMNS